MPTEDELIKARAHLKLLHQSVRQLSRCSEAALEQMSPADWSALFRKLEGHCDPLQRTFRQLGESVLVKAVLRRC